MGSIKQKVLVALVAAGLVPVVIMLVVNLTVVRTAIINAEEEELGELGQQVARHLSGIIDSAWSDLEILRSDASLTQAETPDHIKKESFNRLKEHYEYLREITLLDAKGWPVEPGPNEEARKDQTTYFKKAILGGEVISRPLITETAAQDDLSLRIMVYLPIAEEGKAPHNVVRAEIGFDVFWKVTDAVQIGEQGHFVILDSFGNTLANRDRDRILRPFNPKYDMDFWSSPGGVYTDRMGVEYAFWATEMIPYSEQDEEDEQVWTLICLQPEEEAYALAYRSTSYVFAAAIAAFLVAAGLGLYLSNGLSAPIIRASKLAQLVSKGDYLSKIPETGFLEMKDLAKSFNIMTEELAQHRTHLQSLVDDKTQSLMESRSELEDLTAQLRAAYESTQEAILVVKPCGEIVASNRQVEQFFGISGIRMESWSAIQGDLSDCFEKGDEFSEFWNLHEKDETAIAEQEWHLTSPKERTISIYTAPVRNHSGKTFARLWMFRDLTEQRQLEVSLQQSQKMEAIGRLAGGVAHDFNNLLTGIIGNLALAEIEITNSSDAEVEKFIQSAKEAGQRAAEIVKQLLGFSRRSHLKLEYCNINKVALQLVDLLRHSIDPRIELKTDLSDDALGINADSTQVEQVLMNMCVNAKDAMPSEGGSITIRTENIHLTEGEAVMLSAGANPGDYLRITVEDDGSGMPEGVQEKIFEPFFTTKEQGKGTGLGLATSYGIIQQHGGWIDLDSEIGRGTKFLIYIPGKKPEEVVEPEDAPEEEQKCTKGTETVLLVDDEVVVRAVAESVLKRSGYTIITAGDGLEALEVLQENADSIDVIMMDLTMPRLSGEDAFREMRNRVRSKELPYIPVIICSGYLVDLNELGETTGSRPEGFVQKPYQMNSLLGTIREVIEGAESEVAVVDGES